MNSQIRSSSNGFNIPNKQGTVDRYDVNRRAPALMQTLDANAERYTCGKCHLFMGRWNKGTRPEKCLCGSRSFNVGR